LKQLEEYGGAYGSENQRQDKRNEKGGMKVSISVDNEVGISTIDIEI